MGVIESGCMHRLIMPLESTLRIDGLYVRAFQKQRPIIPWLFLHPSCVWPLLAQIVHEVSPPVGVESISGAVTPHFWPSAVQALCNGVDLTSRIPCCSRRGSPKCRLFQPNAIMNQTPKNPDRASLVTTSSAWPLSTTCPFCNTSATSECAKTLR